MVSTDPWRWGRWVWAAALAAVAVLSLEPKTAPPGEFGIDKLLHVGAFALLAAMPAALHRQGRRGLTLAILMIPYGVMLEWLQAGVPGRSASMADGLADAAGVGLGILVAFAVRK